MSSLVIGLLLIMTGAGGFMATQSLLVLPILVPGVILALGGRWLLKRGVTTPWLAGMLASSIVPMLFFATALPRTVSVLFGGGETVPGSIFAVGLAAILCLVHATLTIRQLVRFVQQEA
jgi:hypothetical protein